MSQHHSRGRQQTDWKFCRDPGQKWRLQIDPRRHGHSFGNQS